MSKLTNFLFHYVFPESFYYSKREPHRCPKCWGTLMTNDTTSPFQNYHSGIRIYCKKCTELVGVEVDNTFYSAYNKGEPWL